MGLKRKENWRELLGEEINNRIDRKFVYGEHDCAIAASACVKSMTGIDLFKGFGKYKGKVKAHKIIKKYGGLEKIVMDLAEKYDMEEIEIPYAQAGDAVLHDVEGELALGIMATTPTHFLTAGRPRGWVLVDKSNALRIWRV